MKSALLCPYSMFGARMRELRQEEKKLSNGKERRLTQTAAADMFGVSLRTYKKWEGGKAVPDGETLLTIAKHFSVSVDYLLGVSSTKTINGNEVCNITGLSPAAVDYLHESHETAEQNAVSWGMPVTEWNEISPSPDCAAVLSRMIESAPEQFLDLIHDINAYFLEAKEAGLITDEERKQDIERDLRAALYSCSVSLSNIITQAAPSPGSRPLQSLPEG